MICLVPFDEDSQVTPLPCDIRHYFHTACIEQWLMVNAMCPLCKTPVTLEEISRVAEMYQRKLVQHEKCCSDHSSHKHKSRQNYAANHSGSTSSYKTGSQLSKDCTSHQMAGSCVLNQTLLSDNRADLRVHSDLEMTMQPNRASKTLIPRS